MKKLILPVVLCLLTLTSIDTKANESNSNTEVTTGFYQLSTFCKLIQMGKYEAVKALIEAGEDVNKKSTGLTPLMFAARHNKAKIAKLLIKHGAKLKAKSDRGRMTALKIAERSKAMDSYQVIKNAMEKKSKVK